MIEHPFPCPKCNSWDLSSKPIQKVPPGLFVRQVFCHHCNAEWFERYQFLGIRYMEGDDS